MMKCRNVGILVDWKTGTMEEKELRNCVVVMQCEEQRSVLSY